MKLRERIKTPGERAAVESEFKQLGLDSDQIRSILNQSASVKPIEVALMAQLPRNEVSGKRASINVVRDILHTLQVLKLIERSDGKPMRSKPGTFPSLRSMPEPTIEAFKLLCGKGPKCGWCKTRFAMWTNPRYGGTGPLNLCVPCYENHRRSPYPSAGWRKIE